MTTDSSPVTSHASTADAPRLESELAVLIRRVRELLRLAAADVHPELPVTGYTTLIRLLDEGPLRASTLVDYYGTDKGSMSRQIANLERLGLVRRTKDPVDGRAQVVSATPLAVRRATAARDTSRRRLRHRIADWDESRVDAFAELLHAFNTDLADDRREPTP